MYKFTNGIVVFDKETRDNYLRAGFTLEKQKTNDTPIKGQINIDEAIEKTIEEKDENEKDDSIIDKKSKTGRRISE